MSGDCASKILVYFVSSLQVNGPDITFIVLNLNKIPLKRDASGPEGYSDTVPVGWTENCALGSFKLQFSFGFVTSCYVIMNTSIA